MAAGAGAINTPNPANSQDSMGRYNIQQLKGDFFGGVTTAVVALPVAVAFGVASGIGAAAGLYAAIAIALFAAVFGGTPGMVSGPTAPMVVAMAVIVTHSASSMAEAFTIVMLAGLFQILFGLCRLGRFIAYTPHSVISGFMTGIGFIIISIQLMPVLGQPPPAGGAIGSIIHFPSAISQANLDAVLLAACTLAMMIYWPPRLNRLIPSTLGALAAGTFLSLTLFTDAPLVGAIPSGLPQLQVPAADLEFLLKVIEPALVLAIIGSINSLVVALIVNAMRKSHQHDSNRELVGQGLANIFSGLFGGLPGSGSTVPSVVNIRSGGSTRLSAILVALILGAFLFDLSRLVAQIPLAVLAALLLRVGWNIIDWEFLMRLRKIEKTHLAVMLLTAALTVFVDLITAVAIGLIASGMINSMQAEQLELDSVISVPLVDTGGHDSFTARTGLVRMSGRFTVASAAKLKQVITEDIREHEVVIFDFSKTSFMDDSALMVIRHLVASSHEQNKPCIVMGLSGRIRRLLHSVDALQGIDESSYVNTLAEARQAADAYLRRKDQAQS